ncbi:MAG: NUDIX domain-containing protein [Ruminiclostridium sp.]|nr:NUDIX domain-containing protein [Ruminiclostridium sp.]
MDNDMTVPCADGIINIRVGAIIMKNGKLLMVGNERSDYLYSVGGRIKFGETAEEAIVREILEETGVRLEIDRLAFVHENYFYGDAPANMGKLIYEISFFFLMKVPDVFDPVSKSFTEDNSREYLCWVAPDTEKKIYPSVFGTLSAGVPDGVRHIVTDVRKII